jgi:NADPH:quinone reductase-like Zn-dependent oxidoreductase
MRAVLMTAVGGPDGLKLAEVPEPEITGEHDVKVRLYAAGINPADYKLRSAGIIRGTLPAVLGWDGAGVVEDIGSAVTRFRPGDAVYFCDGGFGPAPGTYQEVKVVAERYLARSLGADLCIDYRHEDVGARLRDWTGMDGADVVHDTVGGRTFTACFSLTRPYGDLVSNVESRWEDEAVTAMQQRNLRVSFTWMPAPSVLDWPEQRERQRRILDQAATHFDAGELRVVAGATFPLADAADAHRALEAGRVTGKAVLTMS